MIHAYSNWVYLCFSLLCKRHCCLCLVLLPWSCQSQLLNRVTKHESTYETPKHPQTFVKSEEFISYLFYLTFQSKGPSSSV